jgi:cytidine deaminase
MNKEYKELIKRAISVLNPVKHTKECSSGGVGCALITKKGNIFTGVCIECSSGIGFCAEHSAIANMITNKESNIKTIVAVNWDKKILPPCGRCRELMLEIDNNNVNANVIISKNKIVKLNKLMPYKWQDVFK